MSHGICHISSVLLAVIAALSRQIYDSSRKYSYARYTPYSYPSYIPGQLPYDCIRVIGTHPGKYALSAICQRDSALHGGVYPAVIILDATHIVSCVIYLLFTEQKTSVCRVYVTSPYQSGHLSACHIPGTGRFDNPVQRITLGFQKLIHIPECPDIRHHILFSIHDKC